MYGQQGRGSWQPGPAHWQQTNGYHGQQQQQPAYCPQQGYGQQHQHQPMHQYQPPPPSRQPHQQLQHDHRRHHRSHTPNPRPQKRMRQDAAAGGRPEPQQQQFTPQAYQPQQQHQFQSQAWRQQQPPQQLPQPHLQQQQQVQQKAYSSDRPPQQLQHTQQQSQQQAGWSSNASSIASSNPPSRFPSSNHGNPAAAAWLDALQNEILQFVQVVAPSPEEQQQRQSRMTDFTTVTQQALPQHVTEMQVVLFGSGAAGLALHHSDLDVAITGLALPDGDNGGFDDDTKMFVVRCLRRIDREATYGPGRHLLGVTSSRLVGKARIPVLKLQLDCGLELDVSLNDDSGVKAARFLTSFQDDYPAVQPLILLLKSALKQRGLSEVYMGGLGSWSLANMVIAHLMEEDRAGHQADHVGSMLLSFLQRFGVDFNLDRQAVSVKRGGIVAKHLLGHNFTRKEGQLALEDPLTGREVAGGSHRYADVEEIFRRLHERLSSDLAHHHQGISRSSKSNEGKKGGGNHIKFQYSDDDETSDDDDDYGYDAGNRSPTYQAKIRRRRQQQQAPNQQQQQSEFQLLEMVLDCKAALERDAGSVSGAAAVGGGGRGNAGGGRWQWSSGVPVRGTTPVVGRKRERW